MLRSRVLDAFWPCGVTWSGQVISYILYRGPFMTHLLPGGAVPRVHGAQSPVPPRLPLFATPRSVCHLATVAAGAYPLCRPPNGWSPGVPAPPDPCYCLVASGIPVGWRGGCLAVGLMRGSVCHYCVGGCIALFLCARRLRQVRGIGACAGSCVSPVPPSPPPRSRRCARRVVLPGCPFFSPAGTPFHAVRAFRGLGPVALRVSPACPLHVCALALWRHPRPFLPPGSVWRVHLAWFWFFRRSRKHNLQHAYARKYAIFLNKRPKKAVFWSKIEFFRLQTSS